MQTEPPASADASAASLVIRGCDLLPEPGSELAENVDVVIAGDRIVAVEPGGTATAAEETRVIDGRELLAMPGLVNAHTHSPENPMRGIGEHLGLEPWLYLKLAGGASYDPGDYYVCALAGAVEMLHNGVTAVVDHLVPSTVEGLDAVMRAYRDVGIRAAVAPLVSDMDFTNDLADHRGFERDGPLMPWQHGDFTTADLAAQLEDAIGRWHGAEDGRLSVLAGPAGVQWCSDELLLALAAVAERHGTGIHIHLLETRTQADACRLRFGKSAARGLDDMGILSRCSLPHSVWIDESDAALIAERGAIIVHNPASNLRLVSGRAPIPALLEAGATVALGTDGAASSDNQVIWDALKIASLVHHQDHPRWVSARDALRMATGGGAAALGLAGELGSVRQDTLADLVLIDRLGDGLAGAQDIEMALAISETGRGVRHAIVAGKLVVEDGRCTLVDERAAQVALAEQARRLQSASVLPAAAERGFEQLNRFLRG
jgi:cytosine/adenosine deaminase-related metal-dependent hydrolase